MRQYLTFLVGCSIVAQATTLHDTIGDGIAHNQFIKSKEKAIQTAQSRYSEAASLAGFNVNVAGDVGYAKSKTSYERLADAEQSYAAYSGSLSITKPLFNLRNIRLLNRSEIDTARSELEYQKAKEELVLKIVEQYLNVLLKKEMLLATESKLIYHTTRAQEYQKRFDEQRATLPDLLEVQALLYGVQAELNQNENDYKTALQMLRSITGVDTINVESVEKEVHALLVSLKPLESYVQNSSEKFINHLYERVISEGFSRDKAAVAAEGYPQVDLQLTGNDSSTTDGFFGKTASNRLYAGVGVRWSLYNGGQREDKERTALLQMQESALRLEQQKRDVGSLVQKYYNDIQSQRLLLGTYEKSVEASESYYKAVERGYALGVRKITDLLEAKNRVDNAKLQYQKGKLQIVLAGYYLRYYGAEYSFKDES